MMDDGIFRKIVDEYPAPTAVVRENSIVYANRRFSEIFGKEGKCYEIIHRKRKPCRSCMRRALVERDGMIFIEDFITFQNGGFAVVLKEVEEEIAEKIISRMPNAVLIHDNTKIISINDACLKLLHASSAEEVVGKNVSDFIGRMKVKEHLEGMAILEGEISRLDGSRLSVEIISIPLFRAIVLTIIRDVSKYKKLEKMLVKHVRKLNAVYRLNEKLSKAKSIDEIYKASIEAIKNLLKADRASILLIEDGVMRFKAWSGLSAEYRRAVEGHNPWIGRKPEPIIIPDVERDESLGNVKEVVLKEGIRALAFIPLVYEKKLLGKFMIYYNRKHEFSEDEIKLAKTIANHIAFAVEKKRSEERLKESEEMFRKLFELMPDYAFIYDSDLRIIDVNERVLDLFGVDKKDIINMDYLKIFKKEDVDRARKRIKEALSGKKLMPAYYEIVVGDRKIPVLANTSAIKTSKGTIFLSTLRDVRELKEKEEKLREAYKKLKEAYEQVKELDFLKSAIIANVSHELKTPLTIAKAVVDILIKECDQKSAEMARTIKKNIIRLLNIIEDMISVAKIVSGKYKLYLNEVYIGDLVYQAIKEKKELADQKGIRFFVDVGDLKITCDKDLFYRAVLNLLDNAIKFNKEGGKVFIRAYEKDSRIFLEIEDTGIGIPKDKIKDIFEVFIQLDPSARRRYGGTGLGLALVKRILELHGCRIHVESEVNKGTKFTIEFSRT